MATHALTPPYEDPGPHDPAPSSRPGWLSLSLYTRVVVVNTTILLAAVLALVLSPVTVSFPLVAEQGVVLGLGAVVIVLANALLLRVNFRGLATVVRRMETIDVLQPQERLPMTGGPEARALIAGFNAMLERLEAERRTSTRRTLSAIEDERRRLGHELHDEVGQRLTGTLLQLRRLSDEVPSPLQARVDAIQEEQRHTIDEVGALAWQLRPAMLDDLGLLSAIDALVDTLGEPAPAAVTARLPGTLRPMPLEVELVVYRIAQEALTNAVRHAEAANIGVELREEPDQLILRVQDDGRGISQTGLDGPGVRGMRERALQIGARLHVGPGHGAGTAGTRVQLWIRWPWGQP